MTLLLERLDLAHICGLNPSKTINNQAWTVLKPVWDETAKICGVHLQGVPTASPFVLPQSGMKWAVYYTRQLWEAFSPQEVNFLLPATLAEFILNHVSLTVYSHYDYLEMQVLSAPPPLCKCQNAAEMFDNSGMQICLWCVVFFFFFLLRYRSLLGCESEPFKGFLFTLCGACQINITQGDFRVAVWETKKTKKKKQFWWGV